MRQVLAEPRSPYPRLVGTTAVWGFFTGVCLYVLPGVWNEFGPAGRVAVILVTCVFAVLCVGSLVGFLPQGNRCRAISRGDRIVAVESWFLRIEGCDLRRTSGRVFDVDHAPVYAPTTNADDRDLERWVVEDEGVVVRHLRVWAMLYTVGKDAPKVVSPWADVKPPVRGGAYLIHPGDVASEQLGESASESAGRRERE